MLSYFLKCPCCKTGLTLPCDSSSFPLCAICIRSLISCPRLCSSCGSPVCLTLEDGSCIRPWIRRPQIHSYSALYLLIEPCYPLLKRWKISRGLLFDRKVLKPNTSILEEWKGFGAEAVIPIPQRYFRAWKMRGSRAQQIAEWVSATLRVPMVQALTPPVTVLGREKRQAELTLHERLKRRLEFGILPEAVKDLRNIILVDDFMTSGKTLEQAAITLQSGGVQRIHVFCLGVKPPRFYSQG